MLRINRSLPLLTGLLGVLICAATMNTLLLGADALFPAWITSQNGVAASRRGSIVFKYAEKMERRIQLAEEDIHREPAASSRPLCVILGLSSVGHGFDLATMDAEDHSEYRYLHIAAAGATMSLFLHCGDLLTESELRPELVILGIHPFFLVDEEGDLVLREEDGQVASDRNALSAVLSDTVNRWVWPMKHRNELVRRADFAIAGARSRAMHVLGRIEAPQEPEDKDPWSQAYPRFPPPSTEVWENDAKRRLAVLERMRKFEPDAYREFEESSSAELVELIRRLENGGARVVVLLMSEHSRIRNRVPGVAREMLVNSLRDEFTSDTLTILDAAEALPDSEYFDLVHANLKGAVRLSRAVAAWIGRRVPSGHPSSSVEVGSAPIEGLIELDGSVD